MLGTHLRVHAVRLAGGRCIIRGSAAAACRRRSGGGGRGGVVVCCDTIDNRYLILTANI